MAQPDVAPEAPPATLRSAETTQGTLIHATLNSETTLCGHQIYSLLNPERWPADCPRCVKAIAATTTAGA